jgi:hypothetical protein
LGLEHTLWQTRASEFMNLRVKTIPSPGSLGKNVKVELSAWKKYVIF